MPDPAIVESEGGFSKQPVQRRICVCEHHATHHSINLVAAAEHPWGEWVLLLATCNTCGCEGFTPSDSGRHEAPGGQP